MHDITIQDFSKDPVSQQSGCARPAPSFSKSKGREQHTESRIGSTLTDFKNTTWGDSMVQPWSQSPMNMYTTTRHRAAASGIMGGGFNIHQNRLADNPKLLGSIKLRTRNAN